jgi:benzodiazapine receptor
MLAELLKKLDESAVPGGRAAVAGEHLAARLLPPLELSSLCSTSTSMAAHSPVTARRQALVLLAFVAACVGVGAVGGAVTATSVGTWYQQLRKPSFNPPDRVFGPVWTALYIAMAVAAWRVWRRQSLRGARLALTLFAAQLALNLGWSVLFFGMRQIGLALIEIAVLFIAIVSTASAFARTDGAAALLLVPHLTWVAFAAMLNWVIWRLN